MTDEELVRGAIAGNEFPEGSGRGTDNETIAEVTGLGAARVAEVLETLWRTGQIEGILTLGQVRPHLVGILRVLPDRERSWGADGFYKPQA